MGECFLVRRGGGGGIGLRTICVESADALPTTAKDGTIAIVSNVKPKTVWVQNTEPTDPDNGDLWMTVSDNSSVPVQLKTITFYPTSFKQYIDGAWVSVAGYVRVNGEWLSLELWLFKTGDPYMAITGGWAFQNGLEASADVTITSATDNLVLTTKAIADGSYASGHIYTVNKIAAGRYNRLVVTLSRDDDNGLIYAGFGQNATDANFDVYVTCDGTRDAFHTYELDVSNIGSDYEGYFKIRLRGPGNGDPDEIIISEAYLCN